MQHNLNKALEVSNGCYLSLHFTKVIRALNILLD